MELIVGSHLPTGQVAVVPSHQLQPASCRAQEADVRNCPVASVEYVDIRPAVAVEVADEELVSSTELPAWHAAVVARNQVHLPGAIVGNQAQVGHDPVGAIEDEHLVLAVLVEVAGEEPVVRLKLPGTRHTLHSAEGNTQSRAVRSVGEDGVPVVNQAFALAIPIEVARVGIDEGSTHLGVVLVLHGRVADRTVWRRVGAHPAVDHRSIDAGEVGVAALEDADTLVVVPVSRSSTRGIACACPDTRGYRCGGVDEVTPLFGCPVEVYG